MNNVKSLIRDYEREKDSFKKLMLLGTILNELETIKKELSKKVR